MKKMLSTYWPGLLIVAIAAIIGIEVYQDYGISYDELSQRMIGEKTLEYAMGKNPDYQTFPERDHGPGFEWVLLAVEKTLNITEYRDIYLMRHLTTYLFFILCMFSGYVLVQKLFNNKWLASIILIALIFHPTLFAHSFFNPKDIPAASIFLLSIVATHWAFAKQKYWPFLLLGVIYGYSACIRLTNLVIAAPVFVFLIVDTIQAFRTKTGVLRQVCYGLLLLVGSSLALYISWPALWINPINSFIEMYQSNANFRWVDYVLFGGQKILSTELPWAYIPTWAFITTPELWVISGLLGAIIFTIHFGLKPGKYLFNSPNRTMLLAFCCFLLPLVIVIVLHAVLYDGWRHMYFIYPPFIILMAYGMNVLIKKGGKKIWITACIAQIMVVGWFMVKYHPFQQVYFNYFVSHKDNYLYNNYELDYWASCHKQAVEWLYKNTDAKTININRDNAALRANYHFVPADVRTKVIETKGLDSLDYYIEFFRTNPFKFPGENNPHITIIHEEKVLNSPIYRIVKMR